MRWKNRFREIARAKEAVCDAYTGGKEYHSSFPELEKYFYHVAYAARFSGRSIREKSHMPKNLHLSLLIIRNSFADY